MKADGWEICIRFDKIRFSLQIYGPCPLVIQCSIDFSRSESFRTPLTGGSAHHKTSIFTWYVRHNKYRHTCTSLGRFEPMIPMFQMLKTVFTSYCAATLSGNLVYCKYYVLGHHPSSCLNRKTPSSLFFKTRRFDKWILSPPSGVICSVEPNLSLCGLSLWVS
jgi:hypothetical protein